jgi:glucosamine-6-phosphate deaminase
MRIIINPDKKEVGKWSANYIIEKINKANPTPEKPFILGLPTGSSLFQLTRNWSKDIKLEIFLSKMS